ncbi:hypothetical protein DRV85_11710 [Rhodosalinus halophilus]|uniref:Flagellar hook-length control protein-like C-terminal domain-containing protein n=1 Tax=Rhodosalinus halophilus TaxID=2259333 RepID=A0A365U865_9RHOB|nr:flagellar hook-length control protein FliK [Rhodosalinus halophilus]RBI84614.1 hypothetical protein DRV85_11710 [Rhodosalinus halophilus]
MHVTPVPARSIPPSEAAAAAQAPARGFENLFSAEGERRAPGSGVENAGEEAHKESGEQDAPALLSDGGGRGPERQDAGASGGSSARLLDAAVSRESENAEGGAEGPFPVAAEPAPQSNALNDMAPGRPESSSRQLVTDGVPHEQAGWPAPRGGAGVAADPRRGGQFLRADGWPATASESRQLPSGRATGAQNPDGTAPLILARTAFHAPASPDAMPLAAARATGSPLASASLGRGESVAVRAHEGHRGPPRIAGHLANAEHAHPSIAGSPSFPKASTGASDAAPFLPEMSGAGRLPSGAPARFVPTARPVSGAPTPDTALKAGGGTPPIAPAPVALASGPVFEGASPRDTEAPLFALPAGAPNDPAAAALPDAPPPRTGDGAARLAQQVAEAAARSPDRVTDIALEPEELGRLRLGIVTGDTSVTVQIQAERPETLDLLRRHLDQLTEEFRRLGYASVAIDIGSDGASSGGRGGEDPSSARAVEGATETDLSESNHVRAARPPAAGGLDLRL